ncbi:MAG: FAD-dependent oxidoreductase [Planctomycetes bacterium]|nr:FAD-dependent oxidoreductase [Planctomycetota bacterium]
MSPETFDHVVVGAGLRGLAVALRRRRERPDGSLLVVDAAPQAGGRVRTQRSNGFVCELGPFAFAGDAIDPVLACLAHAPRPIEPLPGALRGSRLEAAGLVAIDVVPAPRSFATGNEELPQACRRELGSALRLARAVAAVRPTAHGIEVDLAGEARSTIRCRQLTLALPPEAAAPLLAPFDPQLPAVAEQIPTEHRAVVHLGGTSAGLLALQGYGITVAAGADTPLAEVVYCTRVFPRRALGTRALVRIELRADAADGEDATSALAITELGRLTGTQPAPEFVRVHRTRHRIEDAVTVEYRARIQAVARQWPQVQCVD